ncbi:4-diphosphocytidyl-2-C-methyl-D-erythritol kinase [Propionibacterium cyclohexanicum]|uniref:4-diphosphocytidyl-2-C-methyl-D-erythritol kinase n=1 Tax=Propionibacterium cyclohexanicum TaxID=64702 RepID=A0A1H9RHJ8_9ACTN|nr:4-(cytidine 5'-diphospho)-2-C-methyl-D-erythritol kinase [Propionibacterium cyclohexanicum]SER72226.1 4-diphosphocytidyl-2-C-methyl-D-erythritol kinase [Propionibacterium cyclohexanicum]
MSESGTSADDSTGPGLSAEDTRVKVRVPAKVNLSLRLAPRDDDGYHPVSTVFQAVSLFDEVVAERRTGGLVDVFMHGGQADRVSDDTTNLAVRAALLLRAERGDPELGVHLDITKAIPVAGGMAGGSADAAASLLACSVLWDLDTTPDDLHELASRLGSDVPFALLGGTAIGHGRGEQLVPALTRGSYQWVLAVAPEGLSTPSVFAHFDAQLARGAVSPMPSAGAEPPRELLNALSGGDAESVAAHLGNDLQEAACELYPPLRRTLDIGTQAGALAAIVSGSGPTCAFLCANQADARNVEAVLLGLDQVLEVHRVSGPVPGAQLVS